MSALPTPATADESPRLLAFVRDLFTLSGWPEGGDIDGFDFQEVCVKHGLLIPHTVTEPCGQSCSCAEYHGRDDMQEGVTCYRKAGWIGEATKATEAAA